MIIKTVIILKADQETLHRSCFIHQMPLKAISSQFPRKVTEAFAWNDQTLKNSLRPRVRAVDRFLVSWVTERTE